MARQRLAIMGAGGLAREVAWLVAEINELEPRFDLLGFIVSDLAGLGAHDSKDRVLGDYAWLEKHHDRVDAIAIGIGSPRARSRVAQEIESAWPTLEWPSLVHPTVRLDRGSATIGRGVALCAGVVATVNVEVADFAYVNLSCTLGHECRVGRGTVINPGSNVSGGVAIGDEVLVGTGARILQYRRIGDRATIGAGAVVTKDVAPETTVVGVPARPLDRRTR